MLIDEAPGEVFEPIPDQQLDLYEGRVVAAAVNGVAAVGRLWLRYNNTGIAEVVVHARDGAPLRTVPDRLHLGVVAV